MQNITKGSRQAKRGMILAIAILVVGGGLGGVYYWRLDRQQAHLENLKPRGIEQVEAGNYEEALHLLKGYLGDHPDDVEALRAFADARQNVYDPKGAHIKQTMEVRRRILELDPSDEASRRDLMDLYVTVGFNAETIEAADKLLAQHPDDPQALRAKSTALFRTDKFDEALLLAKQYNQLKPEDMEAQIQTLSIMQAQGARPRQMIDRASSLLAEHPDDGRFLMLAGAAHQMNAEIDAARQYYKQAVEHLPSDPEEIGRLARLMDQVGLSVEATNVLVEADQTTKEPALVRLLVQRLWEQGRNDQLLKRAETFDPKDPKADTEAIAILSLALLQAGELEPSKAYTTQLEGRHSDRLAQDWARLLRIMEDRDVEAQRLLNVIESVLARHPDHPYFHFFRGQALAQEGRSEQAIRAWQEAAKRAPAWPVPLVRVAQVFLATNRPLLAAQVAQGIVQRSPNNPEAVLTFLEALGPNLDQFGPDQVDQVSRMLDEVLEKAPTLERRLLPLIVAVRAMTGDKEQAAELVRAGLDFQPPLSEETLSQLSGLSRRFGLGLTDAISDAHLAAYGKTPRLAYTQALEVAQTSGISKGIAAFDAAMPSLQDPQSDTARAWLLVRARLLDQLGDAGAVEAWRKVLSQFPHDQRVVRLATDAQTVWSDPALATELVAQIKSTLGEDTDTWRIARAKQVLAKEDVDDRLLAEATSLLLEVTRQSEFLLEPHLLLARCYTRLGSPDRAIESLDRAQQLAPQSVDVALDRMQTMFALNRLDEIDRMIVLLRDRENLTLPQTMTLAQMALRRNGFAVAKALLERILDQAPQNRPARLLLARVFERQGDTAAAAELYDELMQEPDAPTVQYAARFYEGIGELDKAQEVLDQLGDVDLPTDARAMLQAGFEQRRGDVPAATQTLKSAVQAGPARPELWKQLIALQLQQLDEAGAFASAKQAATAHPSDPAFQAITSHQDLIKLALSQPHLQPMSLYFLQDDSHREAATQVLQLIRNADRDKWQMQNVLIELRQHADRNPQMFSIQRLLINLYQSTGQTHDATEIATRTMRTLAESPEAAWLAAETFAAAGQWDKAADATREFQTRTGNTTVASDLMLAEARLQLGEPDAAAGLLSSYADADLTPAQQQLVVRTRARALVQSGKVDEARQLLRPMLGEAPEYRRIYADLAAVSIDDVNTAQRWLEEVRAVTPEDATSELLALAQSWRAIDERFDTDVNTPRAVAILNDLLQRPDAPGVAAQTLGMIYESQGQLDQAEAAYRKALELEPRLVLPKNNLAMVIARRSPAEALPFAREAVQAAPGIAAFQDTLAVVLLANDKPSEAVEAARRAVALDPANIEWSVTLGETLLAAGETDEVRDILQRLDQQIQQGESLPGPLEQRLQDLRQTAGSQARSSAPDAERTTATATP